MNSKPQLMGGLSLLYKEIGIYANPRPCFSFFLSLSFIYLWQHDEQWDLQINNYIHGWISCFLCLPWVVKQNPATLTSESVLVVPERDRRNHTSAYLLLYSDVAYGDVRTPITQKNKYEVKGNFNLSYGDAVDICGYLLVRALRLNLSNWVYYCYTHGG